MSSLPRFAIGTVQPGTTAAALTCALLDLLERRQVQTQCFLSRACFSALDAASAVTGQAARHLDTWLMPEAACRQVFLRGTAGGQWALVEGRFRSAVPEPESEGGDLETLCQWLDLPRIAVVDVSRMSGCHLPPRPQGLDAVLLDRVRKPEQASRLQTALESVWGVPVLGHLEELPSLRCWLRSLPGGSRPPRELCRELGNKLLPSLRMDRFFRLARERAWTGPEAEPPRRHEERLRVAVAYDEAFNCYFADTLDLLELCGADVRDFSPLRDERLPAETDLVYFGCGHPERFLEQLSENHCMTMALLNHLCAGRRIYAEGGGLAYLCRQLETADGRTTPMVGVFPAVARIRAGGPPPRAVELPLVMSTWLGEEGTLLRGYAGSRWAIEPCGALQRLSNVPGYAWHLVGRNHAIGSCVHLNLAAQGAVFDALFAPLPVAVR